MPVTGVKVETGVMLLAQSYVVMECEKLRSNVFLISNMPASYGAGGLTLHHKICVLSSFFNTC